MNALRFLFTDRQQRLLAALLLHPERAWSLSDLLEQGGRGHSGTQQFVKNLLEAGLIQEVLDRKRRKFLANTQHPIFPELASICRKTFGVRDVVLNALEPFRCGITEAFIFGSVAKGTEGPKSDVDIMVIGDVRPSQLLSAQKALEESLGREVHFNVYDKQEWQQLQADDPIISAIAHGPKLELITSSSIPEPGSVARLDSDFADA
jgi:predicted nucleotidyltransferase